MTRRARSASNSSSAPLTRDNFRARADAAAGQGRFAGQCFGRCVRAWRWSSFASRKARSISTPASSRGRAAIPIHRCRRRCARITRCARARWRCAQKYPDGADGGADAWRQSRPGVAFRQAGAARCRRAAARRRAPIAPAGRRSRPRLGIKVDPHRRARHPGLGAAETGRASSSTPGRSTDSSAKARSRPSWAGAATKDTSRPMAGGTNSAAAPRSISTGRAPRRGCEAGRRSKARISAFSSPMAKSISIADYLTVAARAPARLSPDRALRLSPVRRRGAVAARVRRQELAPAEPTSA